MEGISGRCIYLNMLCNTILRHWRSKVTRWAGMNGIINTRFRKTFLWFCSIWCFILSYLSVYPMYLCFFKVSTCEKKEIRFIKIFKLLNYCWRSKLKTSASFKGNLVGTQLEKGLRLKLVEIISAQEKINPVLCTSVTAGYLPRWFFFPLQVYNTC